MPNRKIDYWVMPPQADAEFVASMENVLDTYAKPYDPTLPVVCMDLTFPLCCFDQIACRCPRNTS